MVRRQVFPWTAGVAVLLGIFLLAPARPALAGWWLAKLDQPVGDVQPGQEFTIGFTVISHDQPIPGLAPTIRATSEAGEQVVVTARPEGEPGHYAATLSLPSAGVWQWEIEPFPEGGMRQLMSPIQVQASAAAPAATFDGAELPVLARWLGVALVLSAVALALLSQRGSWWARQPTTRSSGEGRP